MNGTPEQTYGQQLSNLVFLERDQTRVDTEQWSGFINVSSKPLDVNDYSILLKATGLNLSLIGDFAFFFI